MKCGHRLLSVGVSTARWVERRERELPEDRQRWRDSLTLRKNGFDLGSTKDAIERRMLDVVCLGGDGLLVVIQLSGVGSGFLAV